MVSRPVARSHHARLSLSKTIVLPRYARSGVPSPAVATIGVVSARSSSVRALFTIAVIGGGGGGVGGGFVAIGRDPSRREREHTEREEGCDTCRGARPGGSNEVRAPREAQGDGDHRAADREAP